MTTLIAKALPAHYGSAVEALRRYLTHLAASTHHTIPADALPTMFEDLRGLFEQAAAAGAPPIRAVIGADPVEFSEAFLRTHTGLIEHGTGAEPQRLAAAVERAEAEGRAAL